MVWLLGTFIIQITFLNMLIAIMGDTFDKYTELRKVTALKERIELMRDYKDIITWLRLDKSFKYMIVVKPTN